MSDPVTRFERQPSAKTLGIPAQSNEQFSRNPSLQEAQTTDTKAMPHLKEFNSAMGNNFSEAMIEALNRPLSLDRENEGN